MQAQKTSVLKRAPHPESPRPAEWAVGDTANVDLSDRMLARQRAYGGRGARDRSGEVNDKVNGLTEPVAQERL